MPGILPMKVIKVGTSSQSRIAQACDRCRSKKIRCDGIRPCCSQCANVGFECRTSDKLSRRAFPRGYTESLEERVRALEAEVRELKDLLDEKDEKIDMLSRLHGNRQPPKDLAQSQAAAEKKEPGSTAKEDTFRVQASPLLLGVENSDSYFMGPSSGRSFIEFFKRKMQENGKSCPEFNPEAFLHIQGCYPLTTKPPAPTMRVPPRLFSDRCVNIYFQEWAPLFPVLHKPTFLRVYEEFVTDPDKIKNNHKLAQLYLVFSIAALSSEGSDLQQVAACEQQWHRALEAVLMDNTMMTLQCLLLALMYCSIRADYKRLQHYKGIAIGLSHRLGLHQSQKRFSFGVLTTETRKRVFWTLYTLDCFSAAILGLPKLLKEDDVHAEYPTDTDDEYITEKGFQPCLPGEATRLSNALALFTGARVLGKILEKIYPSASSHELSLQQMSALAAELDGWYEKLPPHLRLTFKQDKPSTDVTGSRSPILALAYYYMRTLIYRPAVTSTLGPKAAPALLSVSESSKHMVQIIQLLEERSMAFALCLNKADTLVLCGMVLLYQTMDLKQDSKMLKDNEKLVNEVVKAADRAKAPGCYDMKRVAAMLVTLDEPPVQNLPTPPRNSPDTCLTAPTAQRMSPTAKQPTLGRHIAATISETDLLSQQEKLRRMSMPAQPRGEHAVVRPRGSFDTPRPPRLAQRDHRLSFGQAHAAQIAMLSRLSMSPNVKQQQPPHEYYRPDSHPQPTSPSQGQTPHPSTTQAQQAQIYAQLQKGSSVSTAEWEALLASIEGGELNVYDAIYGGPGLALAEAPVSVAATSPTTTTTTAATSTPTVPASATNGTRVATASWSPDSWDLTGFNLGDFGSATGSSHSVVSLSEDGLSSGDELVSVGSAMEFRNGHLMNHVTNTAEGYRVLDGINHTAAFPL
ncbi:hypothetical protein VTJ83DRAFT_5605 [Remersonia thermophila]|uniref:Zn(2)-C6 fungal-type domain-containing protein n=1 Tax=Remersonia thermophila TaxID=72144 RepID=A0ABR4D7E2_9PEZI